MKTDGPSIAWRRLPPLTAAFAVFVLAAAISAGVIWRMAQADILALRERAAVQAAAHSKALERSIDRSLSATYALAALVREGNGAIRNFDAVAGQMLPLYPGAASLQLAPHGIVRSIVPLAGNEAAIGHDLLKDPARTRAAFAARATGKLTVDGPFPLLQGGMGAVGRLPVFLDGAAGPAFWGFASVVIRFPDALEAARFNDLTQQGLAFQLSRTDPANGQKWVISESSSAAIADPVQEGVHVPNDVWALSVAPVNGWRPDPFGLYFGAALGLFLSALLGFATKLMIELSVHKQGLEVLVEERTAELKSSEARFRALTEMSSDFYWESDAEHRLTQRGSADKSVSSVSVFQQGAQIGLRRWDVPHLSPDEAGWRAHRAVLDAHLPFRDFELSRAGIDGSERHICISGDPVFDAAGKFKGYRGVGRDITNRKCEERALQSAEEQFRSLIEQSIAGSYIIQDDRFAYVNRRFAEIFGYSSADELIGVDASALVAAEDRGKVADNMRGRIEGLIESTSYEFTGLRKDASTFVAGVHGTRAVRRGRPAVIGLLQDISEKKRADEEIAQYIEQLRTAFTSTVEVAMIISEMRDPFTAGHEHRVAAIAVAIGAEMGFDADRQEGLRVAGSLHDVGKITIPAEILSRPGPLSAIEMQLVQGHPQAGYDVLKGVKFPWPVAEVALQHHERMDGSGYPQGLKGEAILLEARIMAAADVIEAMSSHRPYRPALGIEAALAEIERGRGTLYDPAVVDACLNLFREKAYAIAA